MRCGRCGNDNAETNRFCGMCGAPLLSKPDPAGQATPAPPSASSSAAPAPRTAPVAITGPSFLGLSTPGPARDVSPSDHGDPPANLDYLLEDEDEPRRGPGKLILVLVALALAIGFGYLHWRQGGFDWLNASKKPATSAPDAAPAADSSASSPTPDSASTHSAATDVSTPPAAAQPTPSQTTASNSTAPNNAALENAAPVASNPAAPSQPNDSAAPPATAASDQSPAVPTAAAPLPKPHKPAPTKPAAAVPYDPVTEAERYIYGRGARQDCDHGLRLLKPAAEQSNPKAMISMGAIYSTGTCTPRDLPTAYRWFALALHKQPDNQALQDDLKNLWEKMTQPERQLAIKLSQ